MRCFCRMCRSCSSSDKPDAHLDLGPVSLFRSMDEQLMNLAQGGMGSDLENGGDPDAEAMSVIDH